MVILERILRRDQPSHVTSHCGHLLHVLYPCHLCIPTLLPTIQARSTGTVPWQNEAIRQQCPLFKTQNTPDLASQLTCWILVFGDYGAVYKDDRDRPHAQND